MLLTGCQGPLQGQGSSWAQLPGQSSGPSSHGAHLASLDPVLFSTHLPSEFSLSDANFMEAMQEVSVLELGSPPGHRPTCSSHPGSPFLGSPGMAHSLGPPLLYDALLPGPG